MKRELQINTAALKAAESKQKLQEDYISGYIDGAIWADSNPKIQWMDAKKDPPKEGQAILLGYIDGYGKEDVIQTTTEDAGVLYDDGFYWMPIPKIPKVGEQ